MKLLTTSREIEAEFGRLLDQHTQVSFAVAWASIGFSRYDQFVKHRRKLIRAVVGVHFYQTHPDFIAEFMGDDRVRFVKQPDGPRWERSSFHQESWTRRGEAWRKRCLLARVPEGTHTNSPANSFAETIRVAL
ncbi:MAG: hypothetical protein ABSB15_27830 [Bryobacteraceae bacterium]